MTGCGTASLVLVMLIFANGCINRATATLSPGADFSKLKTFYVVHQPKDTHGIHNLIRDRIAQQGLTAVAGPESSQPTKAVDSVITYVDRWMWISPYIYWNSRLHSETQPTAFL